MDLSQTPADRPKPNPNPNPNPNRTERQHRSRHRASAVAARAVRRHPSECSHSRVHLLRLLAVVRLWGLATPTRTYARESRGLGAGGLGF